MQTLMVNRGDDTVDLILLIEELQKVPGLKPERDALTNLQATFHAYYINDHRQIMIEFSDDAHVQEVQAVVDAHAIGNPSPPLGYAPG